MQHVGHLRRDAGHDLQLLGPHLGRDHLDHALDQGAQRKGFILQRDLAGLDLGEVEDVADEGEQGLAGDLDAGRVLLLPRVQGRLQEQAGQAQDAIEGDAQLVAHRGQERRLEAAGALQFQVRLLQAGLALAQGCLGLPAHGQLTQRLLRPLLLAQVEHEEDRRVRHAPLFLQGGPADQDGDAAPILPHILRLVRRTGANRPQLRRRPRILDAIVGWRHRRPIQSSRGQVFPAVAHQRQERVVGRDDAPLAVADLEADHARVGQTPEAHLASAQRFGGLPALLAERGEEQRRRGHHDQEDLECKHPGSGRARFEDSGFGLRRRREQRQAQQRRTAAADPEAEGGPKQGGNWRIEQGG